MERESEHRVEKAIHDYIKRRHRRVSESSDQDETESPDFWEEFPGFLRERIEQVAQEGRLNLEEQLKENARESFESEWPTVENQYNKIIDRFVEQTQHLGEQRKEILDNWVDDFSQLIEAKCEEFELPVQECRRILVREVTD